MPWDDKSKQNEYAKRLFFEQLDRLDYLSGSESESKCDGFRDNSNNNNKDPASEDASKGESVDRSDGVVCVSGATSPLKTSSRVKYSALGSTSYTGATCLGSDSANEIARIDRPTSSPQISVSERRPSSEMPPLKRANTTSGHPHSGNTGSTDRPRSSGKRRRTDTFKAIPEEQQIFKGLLFFFFPNNDISPLRRLRIQRAQEYGALWVKNWEEGITHIIVDKGLDFKDILTFLKLDSLPSNVVVVDECYPSECIKFRLVLSATHTRFRVNGAPCEDKELSLPIEQSSPKSLPTEQVRGQASSPMPQHRTNEKGTSSLFNQSCPNPPGEQQDAVTVQCNTTLLERDALDDIIDEAKAVKGLPLDPPDAAPDEDSPGGYDSDSVQESEAESDKKNRSKPVPKTSETVDWQQRFICMQKHDQSSSSENQNARTIEVLQQMLDYYTKTSDQWRVIAYRKAISALRRHPERVVSKMQALSIPGIGQRLADKVEEIVWTNRLRRLENTSCTPEDRSLQEFLGVYGAGVAQATKWVTQGYRTLEDLRTRASLTTNQRIGIEHYHDFAQRIPRQEVAAHGKMVRKAVQRADPSMQVIISGSYRRGAADCGDIDVLITKSDASIESIRTIMIDSVVPELFRQGFLQASLAVTSQGDGSKWHGASALPDSNVWRRIDLLYVPGSEIGAALIYFTGNDIFNRSMRLLASKKGMCLNQRGLYTDVLRGGQRVKLARGRAVEGRDEKRIFEILGVPWRPPEHRIC